MIQVKGNQPQLFEALQEISVTQCPLSTFREEEKNHGRHTLWEIMVYRADHHPKAEEWKNLRRLIHVHRVCFYTKTRKTVHSDRLYISDLFQTNAQFYAQGTRGHWSVENELHWVKDVHHQEDINRIRDSNAAINNATLSTIALNIHRMKGRKAIKDAQTYAMVNLDKIIEELRT